MNTTMNNLNKEDRWGEPKNANQKGIIRFVIALTIPAAIMFSVYRNTVKNFEPDAMELGKLLIEKRKLTKELDTLLTIEKSYPQQPELIHDIGMTGVRIQEVNDQIKKQFNE